MRRIASALQGFRQSRGAVQLVVPTVVVEGRGGLPQPGQDLQLFGQPIEPLAERSTEGQAVGNVLGLVPPAAQPQLEAPAGDVVHRGRGNGEHARVPEGGRADQSAEPDVGHLRGDRAQTDERLTRPGPSVGGSHGQNVIGAKEPVEAVLAGGLGHRNQRRMRRTQLRFGEDPQVHAPTLGVLPLKTDRKQDAETGTGRDGRAHNVACDANRCVLETSGPIPTGTLRCYVLHQFTQ